MNESLNSPNGMERVAFARLVRLSALELILSPPVQASGGHMNPAISFAMWRFGVFPGAGVDGSLSRWREMALHHVDRLLP
jgi:hypothetical protein